MEWFVARLHAQMSQTQHRQLFNGVHFRPTPDERYFTFIPGCAPLSGESRKSPGVSPEAARIVLVPVPAMNVAIPVACEASRTWPDEAFISL